MIRTQAEIEKRKARSRTRGIVSNGEGLSASKGKALPVWMQDGDSHQTKGAKQQSPSFRTSVGKGVTHVRQATNTLREQVAKLVAECEEWKLRSFDRGLLPMRDSLIADIGRLDACVMMVKQCDPVNFAEEKGAGRQTRDYLIQGLMSAVRAMKVELGKLEEEMAR